MEAFGKYNPTSKKKHDANTVYEEEILLTVSQQCCAENG
jgi:hypothetical protein